MMKGLSMTWDLDSLYPGGSQSQKLVQRLRQIEKNIEALMSMIQKEKENKKHWLDLLDAVQNVTQKLRDVSAFIRCLTAQNMKDEKALRLQGDVQRLNAAYESMMTQFDQWLSRLQDREWQDLLHQDEVQPLAYNLDERRRRSKEKLPPEQEKLAHALSVDGYHAWSDLYHTVVGRMSIPFEEDGKTVELSVGQASNKLSSEKREVRERMMVKWEEAWANEAELCAAALNHLAGYRLSLYRQRGWEDILHEPLEINRMLPETLQTMWDVINRNKEVFISYLNRRAELMGLQKLHWHDVAAPLSASAKKVTYDEAANFIVEQFHRFSPKMADFAKHTFEKRWIEAEDRPGKRPGGFCAALPAHGESRIFMTFDGTQGNVATLAHELGHAYHQHVMSDMPPFTQAYAMNVAETASTFAEMIVADAAVEQAETADERILLLDQKAKRGVAFFMNLQARFLFETRFYKKRKQGLVSVEELNQLMIEAQKEAYGNCLASYHPHFWASKLHFYLTRVPFYNFPYTFGYLFSYAVYDRAKKERRHFEDKYVHLLRDTARMRVEDLAQRHLDADITQPDFWQRSVELSAADAKEFLELTK